MLAISDFVIGITGVLLLIAGVFYVVGLIKTYDKELEDSKDDVLYDDVHDKDYKNKYEEKETIQEQVKVNSTSSIIEELRRKDKEKAYRTAYSSDIPVYNNQEYTPPAYDADPVQPNNTNDEVSSFGNGGSFGGGGASGDWSPSSDTGSSDTSSSDSNSGSSND